MPNRTAVVLLAKIRKKADSRVPVGPIVEQAPGARDHVDHHRSARGDKVLVASKDGTRHDVAVSAIADEGQKARCHTDQTSQI